MTSNDPNALSAENTQPSSSASAAMEKSALDSNSSSLMEEVVDDANMDAAWRRVKANRGAPGPDGITVDVFLETFRHQWPEVRRQLLEGTYRPTPVRRKSIPKPDGGERHLGIPNVVDRLVQQAILQVLTPIFDPEFSDSSFGYRPKRSAKESSAANSNDHSRWPPLVCRYGPVEILRPSSARYPDGPCEPQGPRQTAVAIDWAVSACWRDGQWATPTH